MRLEDAMLFRGGEPTVERQDLGVAELEPAQCISGVADLPLAGEEDEDVAGRLAGERRDGVAPACTWSRSSPSSTPYGS